MVATLEAALAPEAEPTDEALTLEQISEQYHYGPDAIRAAIARGEVAATRGPRSRIEVRRSELERWRASRPVTPRARRRRAEVIDLTQWEAECDRQLSGCAR